MAQPGGLQRPDHHSEQLGGNAWESNRLGDSDPTRMPVVPRDEAERVALRDDTRKAAERAGSDDSRTKRPKLVDALAEAIAAAVKEGEVEVAEVLLRLVQQRHERQR